MEEECPIENIEIKSGENCEEEYVQDHIAISNYYPFNIEAV